MGDCSIRRIEIPYGGADTIPLRFYDGVDYMDLSSVRGGMVNCRLMVKTAVGLDDGAELFYIDVADDGPGNDLANGLVMVPYTTAESKKTPGAYLWDAYVTFNSGGPLIRPNPPGDFIIVDTINRP